jgi:hypothetical protein
MELFKPEDVKQKHTINKNEKKTAKQKTINAEEIKTRTPKNLHPLKSRKRELEQYLSALTSDSLKIVYKFIFGKTTGIKKTDLIEVIAEALTFSTVEQFELWFFSLPELSQRILYETTFTDYKPISLLQKYSDIPLLVKHKNYWRNEWKFNTDLYFDFLRIGVSYGNPVISIPKFLRFVLGLWLEPPPLYQLSACLALDQESKKTWDNSLMVSDTFPLLCDALLNIMEGMKEEELGKNMRNGFNKRDLKELYSSTGFLPFEKIENDQMPDSVDLAARFILCMYDHKPKRPKDGQDGIRNLVQAFFSTETQYPKKWYASDRAYLEYSICIDHLSRSGGYYLDNDNELPIARSVFYNILMHVARDGSWFDTDKLAENIKVTGKDFSFCNSHLERSLKLKAETIISDGITYTPGYDDFRPDGILVFYLMTRPLFKSYCYIFAVLGILEIVQTSPPLVRTYRNKQYPFSVYDSLSAIRITDLGRWCLGLTNERPPKPSQEYHAIADRELLLVTVQGSSLERKVYLDKIGTRLGEDRWRISPASFINGCINKRQITERIERFKMLIDPNPAPHWEQLFKKVINRAGLFNKSRTDIIVYDLPENHELLEELLKNPELKRIVRRVEGRMIAISVKDQKKFYALLNEHGVACF